MPFFSWQSLAVEPCIRENGWGFPNWAKGPRFLFGFSRIGPDQSGVKTEFKQEQENPLHMGRMQHLHFGCKVIRTTEWGSRAGASQTQVWFYSLNLETWGQMPVVMGRRWKQGSYVSHGFVQWAQLRAAGAGELCWGMAAMPGQEAGNLLKLFYVQQEQV